MLLLLMFGGLVALGTLLLCIAAHSDTAVAAGWLSILIGGFGLIVCLILALVVSIEAQNAVISYSQDRLKIEAAIANSSLTGEERASAIDLATDDNSIILKPSKDKDKAESEHCVPNVWQKPNI